MDKCFERAMRFQLTRIVHKLAKFLTTQYRHFGKSQLNEFQLTENKIILYYRTAVETDCEVIQSCIHGLVRENFVKQPVEWYQAIVSVEVGSLREIVEDELLIQIDFDSDLAHQLCSLAVEHNRLEVNEKLRIKFINK